ncbi:MAG TPA: UDP-3-O-(3-hydroxymyristoyl)glucosamine N-acyltransferase [Bacteroidales bacterium]|jgi:UDP-3-O-[3-hydroxymyristoyl] glucosamine N-acyltransferase|nr:UDP-3-O-(3-hydroxymyristoyl)glucosamine N-acyltransferase [Bacteroidales bacterium]
MNISAQKIAEHLGGKIVGDPQVRVSAPARIEQGRPGTICFFANPKYEHYIYTTKASILLVNSSFEPRQEISATLIKVDNAYESVALLLDLFNTLKKSRPGRNRFFVRRPFSSKIGRGTYVGRGTFIGKKVKIGKNCHIYPQVYIGDGVTIGDNTIIYPGVRIYRDSVIGQDVILHANVVIGSDGFGFAPREDGSYRKIPQTGNVIIEDDVEIGAGTTVDRSTMGSTIIRRGVKLDNLCQIAHNVEVGDNTVIAALSGIAGSTKLGKGCILGGQSGIVGHVTIADKTTLAAQSGIIGNVKNEGEALMGYPAISYRDYMRAYALFKASAKK